MKPNHKKWAFRAAWIVPLVLVLGVVADFHMYTYRMAKQSITVIPDEELDTKVILLVHTEITDKIHRQHVTPEIKLYFPVFLLRYNDWIYSKWLGIGASDFKWVFCPRYHNQICDYCDSYLGPEEPGVNE